MLVMGEHSVARRILVIEDNREIADLVALHLRDIGCEVDVAHDGQSGLGKALSGAYDLVILDLMLPEIEGLEICKRIRSMPDYTPILMLTAKSGELDRVLGLEVGADDYLTKPFSIRELLARVKALFRRIDAIAARTPADDEPPIRVGSMQIDLGKRTVTVGDRRVELTAKEFDLLVQFARHPGRAYTRAQLLDLVWGYGHDGYEHTVNTHINRLRAKIEKDPSRPRYILTVWGVGYRFFDPQNQQSG
jgi:DNA-binding response OmpR family regulator